MVLIRVHADNTKLKQSLPEFSKKLHFRFKFWNHVNKFKITTMYRVIFAIIKNRRFIL
jgi:hypothetical protein